jgi:two-component system sensor histidine kinase KdpD
VSKLVAGASASEGGRRVFARPVSERIIRQGSDIDVTLVSTGARDERRRTLAQAFGIWRDGAHSPPRAYVVALAIGGAITLVADMLAAHRFALTNLVMLYLLGVIFAAVRLGRGPGVMLSFLSVAAFDFFFVPPVLSFCVKVTQYLLSFFVMLLT